ncbi:hypothetical protein F4779DRAFT_633922 [Xylariaceae sp. FL0662B]|nr:hypothetical protein F4779DRAFT_633922 [Xylariaceae sp. FL0662B]
MEPISPESTTEVSQKGNGEPTSTDTVSVTPEPSVDNLAEPRDVQCNKKYCTRPPGPGRKSCEYHAECGRMATRKLKSVRKANGLCRVCAGPRDEPGFLSCSACRAKANMTQLKRNSTKKANGLCRYCVGPLDEPRFVGCSACRDKMALREAQRATRHTDVFTASVCQRALSGGEGECCGGCLGTLAVNLRIRNRKAWVNKRRVELQAALEKYQETDSNNDENLVSLNEG